MSRYKDDRLINKVDELAASLNVTSEVLTTADHMIEHYRDLNKEQDAEIARVCQDRSFYILYCKLSLVHLGLYLLCSRKLNFDIIN